mgnify:CR=1 FL=1
MKKWRPLDGKQIVYGYPSDSASIMARLIGQLDERMAEFFPGEDEPKPEPAPEDPPDYSCPICGESAYVAVDDYVEPGPCKSHEDHKMLAAANRRIAQLTRERDEWENECKVQIRQAEAERDGIRAQAIQDTKDAAVKALYYVADNYADGQQAFSRHLRWAADHFRHLEV